MMQHHAVIQEMKQEGLSYQLMNVSFFYGSIDDKLRHTIVEVALEVTFLRLVFFTANFDIVNDAIYYQ